MSTLYQYVPVVTDGPNGTDYRPSGPDGEDTSSSLTEIAEIDGLRYVSVPEGVTPEVPEQIAETWAETDVTDALREKLRTASPHLRQISERVQDKIRAKYALEDELYFARIAVGALQGSYTPTTDEIARLDAYQIDVEAIREWARSERAALGL